MWIRFVTIRVNKFGIFFFRSCHPVFPQWHLKCRLFAINFRIPYCWWSCYFITFKSLNFGEFDKAIREKWIISFVLKWLSFKNDLFQKWLSFWNNIRSKKNLIKNCIGRTTKKSCINWKLKTRLNLNLVWFIILLRTLHSNCKHMGNNANWIQSQRMNWKPYASLNFWNMQTELHWSYNAIFNRITTRNQIIKFILWAENVSHVIENIKHIFG